MEKENNFPDSSFDMRNPQYFIQDYYNFTYIVANIIVPVFDLRRSFGNVKSGKSLEKFI